MKYAYITGMTSDDFLPGVLTMYASLNRCCKAPGIERLCFVTDNISGHSRKVLEQNKIRCIRVNMNNISGFGRWGTTFTKLEIFQLEEYDKLVWVDADMLILNNLDDLFSCPHMSCVRTRTPVRRDGNNIIYGFNSGLMVIVPNKQDYQKILESIPQEVSKYQGMGITIGDQNVLNDYYSLWGIQPEKHLPDGYNVFWGSIDSYIKDGYSRYERGEKQLSVIHFTGKHKPWIQTYWFWIKTYIRAIRYHKRLPYKETRSIINLYNKLLKTVLESTSKVINKVSAKIR